MIGSFTSGATASLVAKNGTKKLSQTFEELKGSNVDHLSGVDLAGLPKAAIFNL